MGNGACAPQAEPGNPSGQRGPHGSVGVLHGTTARTHHTHIICSGPAIWHHTMWPASPTSRPYSSSSGSGTMRGTSCGGSRSLGSIASNGLPSRTAL
eukprot:scaffold62247_cov45-Phaeocystis_antarctica.AAC.1